MYVAIDPAPYRTTLDGYSGVVVDIVRCQVVAKVIHIKSTMQTHNFPQYNDYDNTIQITVLSA